MMIRVGITGGIGSGKSTVSRVFESLGIPVYYSDPRAKQIMIQHPQVVSELTALLGPGTYRNGELDRQYVASRIFTDKELIESVNAIVHPRVAAEFEEWAGGYEGCGVPYVIMECAIMFESGFDRQVDYVVTVSAPEQERIARASSRDGIDPQHVRNRMANQMDDHQREALSDFTIANSDTDMALPRVLELHNFFCDESGKQHP